MIICYKIISNPSTRLIDVAVSLVVFFSPRRNFQARHPPTVRSFESGSARARAATERGVVHGGTCAASWGSPEERRREGAQMGERGRHGSRLGAGVGKSGGGKRTVVVRRAR